MNVTSGSGRLPASPPAEFPLYGLDPSWPGARWVESSGDAVGGPPRWVSLGHQSATGDALVVVTTYARQATGAAGDSRIPTDAQAAKEGQSLLQYAAFAAVELVNMTLPVQSRAQPPGFLGHWLGTRRRRAASTGGGLR
jgi:hypothetical protein